MPGASLLMNSRDLRTSALIYGYGLLALHRHGMALGYPVQIASRFLGGICFHPIVVMSDPGVPCQYRSLLILSARITARLAATALLAFSDSIQSFLSQLPNTMLDLPIAMAVR
jgi:hypothetical protein